MQTRVHPLPSPSLGTQRSLTSLHFGPAGSGRKIYLQASLHADELPGMLVAHHLRQLLLQAEVAGQLLAEIVLVPMANPIGLAQRLLHAPMGRFEQSSGRNFNRDYPQLVDELARRVEAYLTSDAAHNTGLIRQVVGQLLHENQPLTELDGLRQTLMLLAHDADVVLDLHCDVDAVLHLYTETPYWPQAEALVRYLGVESTLLNQQVGGSSFDEVCSGLWWQLAERFAGRFPVNLACFSATVELRGEADVSHELARGDATQLMAYLQHVGAASGNPPPLPPLKRQPTPLAGSENLRAPLAGLVVYLKQPGDWVEAGDTVCEVIEPVTGVVTPVRASVSGLMYARSLARYATRGMGLADVAGATAFRSGDLLSP
jgi:predicted deacylase